ncbi:MAG: hypothetical protein HZA09_04605, partial [Nitrospirae bacterium]|nr:hypothetical protein [Nitrospirota bacterium]
MKTLLKILVLAVFIGINANYAVSSEVQKTGVTLEEELRWLQAEAVVFIASRSEQKVSETPAAVFVITRE